MNSSISHNSTSALSLTGNFTDEDPFLSVIIATRNEVGRLTSTISALARHMEALSLSFEIIVADDASTDTTVARCRALPFGQVRVLENRLRRGPAEAVKNGLLIARGAVVLVAPSNLTAPVDGVFPLIECLLDADIVLGAPSLPASHNLSGDSAMTRSCFRLFRREATSVLFQVADFDDDRLDSEILFLADRIGLQTIAYTAQSDSFERLLLST